MVEESASLLVLDVATYERLLEAEREFDDIRAYDKARQKVKSVLQSGDYLELKEYKQKRKKRAGWDTVLSFQSLCWKIFASYLRESKVRFWGNLKILNGTLDQSAAKSSRVVLLGGFEYGTKSYLWDDERRAVVIFRVKHRSDVYR